MHWCEPWAQWVVTCWDDVRDVLLDSDRFSSAGYEAGFVENLETRLGLQLPALRHHFSTEVLSLTDPPVAHATAAGAGRKLHPARGAIDRATGKRACAGPAR